MKYIILAIVASCVTTLMLAQSNKESKFNQVKSLKNKISDHSLISKYDKSQSKLSCARECSNDDHCSSFFYNKNQHFCSLHSEEIIRPDQTTDMDGTMFFKLHTARNYTGKGYTFNVTADVWYKVSHKKMTWASAVDKCKGDGAALISTNTQQKRELLEYLKLAVLKYHLPWIGCRKTESGDWLWLDGTAVDKSNWYFGHPYVNSPRRCCTQYSFRSIRMKWFCYLCDAKHPFVCEISP